MNGLRARGRELAAAFALLTRLPMPGGDWPAPEAAIWAYPLAGGVVGALGAAAFALLAYAGASALLAAIWALAAMLLATGALHEDGLADTADGFGGGGNAARRLAIMRDSRIGSYGALALIAAFALRVAAIAALARPGLVAPCLIGAAMLARAALLVPLYWLPPARSTGLAAAFGPLSPARLTVAWVLAAIFCLLALPPGVALAGIAAALLAAAAIGRLARRQIGGHTGDVLGATAVTVECVVLSLFAVAMR